MQRISLSNIQPGMVPAYNVFSSDGVVLVRSGVMLTEQFIKRLQTMGIGSIHITNPLFEDITIPELIKEDIRINAIKTIQTNFVKFAKTQELRIEPLNTLANSIVEDIMLNSDTMINMVDTRSYHDYVFGHSVNVCILSVLTGLMLGYNGAKLKELAIGALLHDIGLMLVKPELLTKPGKLAPEELAAIRKHTELGFNFLRKIREITTPAAHISYQHHENFNGSGYPRGLKGTDIHEFARIVAIANMYDALISDRPYRKALLPHEAYELLMTMTNTFFDNEILDVFLANIAIYPIGSLVQLSTNELAIVIKVYPRLQSRPIVRLLTDSNGNRTNTDVEIDLTKQLTIFVNRMLSEKEIIEFSHTPQHNRLQNEQTG